MYYPGNKNVPGLIHKIINNIPLCTAFYEPFAGSAAVSVFLSVLPGIKTIFFINDLDPAVTAGFNYPSGCIVSNQNAFDILDQFIYGKPVINTFVFIDPPYHHCTRPDITVFYNC